MIILNEAGLPQFDVDASREYDGSQRYEAPVAGKGPFVQFYARAMQNGQASLAEGKPVFRSVLFFKLQQPGERDFIDRQATKSDIDAHPAAYQRYRQFRNDSAIADGTPLETLFPAHPDTVEVLKFNRIHTVEALANLSDTGMQNIGMGGAEWRDKARRFIDATTGGKGFADLEDQTRSLQAQLDREREKGRALVGQVEELTRAVSQLTSQLSSIQMGAAVASAAPRIPAMFTPPPMNATLPADDDSLYPSAPANGPTLDIEAPAPARRKVTK
jgi:hypothetical protein